MQTESLPGCTSDRSGSRNEDTPSKLILKIVINKCKRRSSGTHSPLVAKMSDLKEDDFLSKTTESKETLDTTIAIEGISKITTGVTAGINSDSKQNQDEETTEKQKVKTMKIKITISEEDDGKCDPTQKKTMGNTITCNDNDKAANRKVSVIADCEGNSPSLILKTPEKEEKFEYQTLNEENMICGNEFICEESSDEDEVSFTTPQDLEIFHLLTNEEKLNKSGTNVIEWTSSSSENSEVASSCLTDEHKPISSTEENCDNRDAILNTNATENEQKAEKAKPVNGIVENCANLYTTLNISAERMVKESTEKPENVKSLIEQKPTSSIEGSYDNLNATLNTSLGFTVDDSTENEEKTVNLGEENRPESFYRPSFPQQLYTPKILNKNSFYHASATNNKLNYNESMFVKQINYKELCNNRDSLLIHDIVMEHYYEVLTYFTKKSMRRKLYRRSVSLLNDKDTLDLEMEPIQFCLNKFHGTEKEITPQPNGKSLDSGLHNTASSISTDTLESLSDAEQKFEYDENAFLREALGEELMDVTSGSEAKLEPKSSLPSVVAECTQMYGTERSIGSNELSALVSSYDKSAIYSLYSTVNKTTKKKPLAQNKTSAGRPLFGSTSSSSSDGFYESIDTYKSLKADKLIEDIYVQSVIANQVAKALSFCKSKPKLFGTMNHLEAEKILLHTSYKMEILSHELEKNEYEEMEKGQSHGTIKIQNLKFSSKANKIEQNKDFTQYYVCLVHSGATVLASDVILSEKNGAVIFKNCFEFSFNSLLSEIELNISLYCLNIKNNRSRKTLCFSPNKIYSAQKYEKGESNNNEAHSRTSGVQLLGKSKIGVLELSRRDNFKLEHVPPHTTISGTFTAGIQIGLKINNKFSGFLTIGTSNTQWNRRWCTLNGFYLMYWNCPFHEIDETPIGIIDLQHCITREVMSADKSICSRPRTFVLEMKINEEDAAAKSYFFSADNLSELKEWKKQMNAVLMLLRTWKKLKCQTVLLDN